MTPELAEEELIALHKEATDLYDLYFRSNAKHKVNVEQDIALEIFSSKFNYLRGVSKSIYNLNPL